jgi:prepilin-type N-terminal cleavage/methylation domain-containing protein
MRRMRTPGRGFTLIELMVTLSLAAIVLSLAAPSFGEFRRNSRLTSAGNDFLAAMQVARSEAIKRQQPVAVCPTADPDDPAATCTGGPFAAWIVFVDPNNDCLRGGGGEPLIKSDYADDTLTVISTGACVSFAATGFRQTAVQVGQPIATRTVFCDDRGLALQSGTDKSAARGVYVTPTGRSRVTRDLSSTSTETNLNTWGLACP